MLGHDSGLAEGDGTNRLGDFARSVPLKEVASKCDRMDDDFLCSEVDSPGDRSTLAPVMEIMNGANAISLLAQYALLLLRQRSRTSVNERGENTLRELWDVQSTLDGAESATTFPSRQILRRSKALFPSPPGRGCPKGG